MKQGLQIKLGHQLSMTPQLQQAIKLLQMSSLDLHLEIQQALYSNPMLELDEDLAAEPESEDPTEDFGDLLSRQADEHDWNQEIPDELPVDANWDDVYDPTTPSAAEKLTTTHNSQSKSESTDFEAFHSVTESLKDHLLWQLNLTTMSEIDRLSATTIIDNISSDGFLLTPIEELWAANFGDESTETASREHSIELDEMLAVLHRVQQFDPPGVAAHDLRECLLIQLRQLREDTPWRREAIRMVDAHLGLIAERNLGALNRKTGFDETAISAAIELIQSLSPRPGEAIQDTDTTYVEPDVSVRKIEGRWVVSLNSELLPKLCINQEYAKLVQRANPSEDNTFLRDNLQEARWFIRSLESRNDTLMRVSRTIIEKQQGFLERGPEAMKPMILADIADLLGLHESTISRVTTQKYIDTPRGVYELKYFFSSHVNTASGGECSSTAIRAMLKRIIGDEPPAKPYSDSKLANMLQAEGIEVARRTVAKYRESMKIPSSSDRKRFKQSA